MTSVRKLLETKSGETWTIRPDATAYEALQLMSEKNIGALLVTKDDDLVGIFSERDYARKVILKGKSSKETTVGELMSHPVYYVTPEMTIGDCMAIMGGRRVRHLPVMENQRVAGVVSISDVVNRIISEQQIAIRDLESYITGGYADSGVR